MISIAEARKRRGISQREMAARAGVSFRGVQLLERPGHNWRVSTMARAAEALGLPGRGVDMAVGRFLRLHPDSVRAASTRMALDGFESWKTHLFDFVDAFRSVGDVALVGDPPVEELDSRLRALCASVAEALCHEFGIRAPGWCEGVPGLGRPWFVSGIENLKAAALVESPVWFRSRNIFVLDNFLSRA